MTAAEYALILDPERKQEGWWCPSPCEGCSTICYFGPPDIHTARSETWRGEVWLEARGYSILRANGYTFVRESPGAYTEIVENTDHAAAIAEAVRRVNDGQQ